MMTNLNPFRILILSISAFLLFTIISCSSDDGGDDFGVVNCNSSGDIESETEDDELILSYLGRDENTDYKVDISESGEVLSAVRLQSLLDPPQGSLLTVRGDYVSYISFSVENERAGNISVRQVNMKNSETFSVDNAFTLGSDELFDNLISTQNRLILISLTNHSSTSTARNILRIYNKTTGETETMDLPSGEVVSNYAISGNYLILQTLNDVATSVVQSIDYVNAEVSASMGFDAAVSGTIINDRLYVMGESRSYEVYEPCSFELLGTEAPSYLNFPGVGFFETSSLENQVALDYRWAAPNLQSVTRVPVVFDLSSNEFVVNEEVFLNYFDNDIDRTNGLVSKVDCSFSLSRDLVIITYSHLNNVEDTYSLRYLDFDTNLINEVRDLPIRPSQLFID